MNDVLKTTDPELLLIWDDLQEIFLDYKKLNAAKRRKLKSLGWSFTLGNTHTKVYMKIKGKTQMMIISTTPSDPQAGRQILRQIRRMYEGK